MPDWMWSSISMKAALRSGPSSMAWRSSVSCLAFSAWTWAASLAAMASMRLPTSVWASGLGWLNSALNNWMCWGMGMDESASRRVAGEVDLVLGMDFPFILDTAKLGCGCNTVLVLVFLALNFGFTMRLPSVRV